MKALGTVYQILSQCDNGMSTIPPTLLYNEGWMLRLLLEWFSKQTASGHPLGFSKGARWYSEALIPSAFLPMKRGDTLAESWTHADGVIGQFAIGAKRDTDLSLLPDSTTFKVLEAKMLSKLSKGTKHAPYFNQAARNIACIAETLRLANKNPLSMISVAFYVIAPKTQIAKSLFTKELSRDDIREKVEQRVNDYDTEQKPDKEKWFKEWFVPTLEKTDVQSISWEEILDYVSEADAVSGNDMNAFYNKCKQYNKIEK